jgi:hypothetical protein
MQQTQKKGRNTARLESLTVQSSELRMAATVGGIEKPQRTPATPRGRARAVTASKNRPAEITGTVGRWQRGGVKSYAACQRRVDARAVPRRI